MIKQIARQNESSKVQCDCGHVFWCDPLSEENLVRIKREKLIILVPCCPSCAHVDYEWAKATYQKEKKN